MVTPRSTEQRSGGPIREGCPEPNQARPVPGEDKGYSGSVTVQGASNDSQHTARSCGRMNVGDSCVEQLTFEQAFIGTLDLFPDGERLLVSSDRGGNLDLWTLPIGGTDMTQLTTDRAPDWSPRVSPDGKRIAFHSYRSGDRDVWVMPSDGGPRFRSHGILPSTCFRRGRQTGRACPSTPTGQGVLSTPSSSRSVAAMPVRSPTATRPCISPSGPRTGSGSRTRWPAAPLSHGGGR